MTDIGKKKGFTLIELLIVVVVIATMMGILFRLAGVGGDSQKRNTTISRIQKLEFALSGYFAAFGTYPPVPLHGSRDIYQDVNDHGIQKGSGKGSATQDLEWNRVRAACLSQPIAVEYPYNDNNSDEKEALQTMSTAYSQNPGDSKVLAAGFQIRPSVSPSDLDKYSQWGDIQLFKFGVLSFLMPRYLFMLSGEEKLYDSGSRARLKGQWAAQNSITKLYNLQTGRVLTEKWSDIQQWTRQRENSDVKQTDLDNKNYRQIVNQPSQIVCARWMQAFDGIVSGGRVFFGVDTRLDHDDQNTYRAYGGNGGTHPIYSASEIGNAQNSSNGQQYRLDGMTIFDGWGNDIYYYSPPPFQGYRVWSGGSNGMTVPPWIDTSTLDAKNRKTAASWLADDITSLSASSN